MPNDPIGPSEDFSQEGEAESFRDLEVDHEFVLDRRLYRQIGGLFAFENAIDVTGRTSVPVDLIRTVGDQTAAIDVAAVRRDRGQSMLGRKCDDQIATSLRNPARCHNQAAVPGGRQCRDGAGTMMPMRRIRSRCCARAASGHATAAPPSVAKNFRRPMWLAM